MTMHHHLLRLLADNRAAGLRMRAQQPCIVRAKAQAADGATEATLYIYNAIVADEATAEWFGGVSAEALVPQIDAARVDRLHLRINSPGGDVFAGQAIGAALQRHSAQVIAHIDGLAASAATDICCHAAQVLVAQGAMYMIHNSWTFAMGDRNELAKTVELLGKVDSRLAEQYARFSGRDVAAIMAQMDAETWFSAQEAIDAGFAHAIDGQPEDDDQTSANAAGWVLSAYRHAPQQPAGVAPSAAPHATDDHRARQQQRLRLLARI